MTRPQECDHDSDDYELIKACRSCSGDNIEKRPLSTSKSSGIFTSSEEETLSGYYCFDCQKFTMASVAEECPVCGYAEWLYTMDEEIFGH